MPQLNLKLSPHDQQVLESVFNPLELSGVTSQTVAIQAELELVDNEPDTKDLQASRELELQAVRLTEKGELDEALLLFGKALQVSERASVFNNRAQTLRLAKRDQGERQCWLIVIDRTRFFKKGKELFSGSFSSLRKWRPRKQSAALSVMQSSL